MRSAKDRRELGLTGDRQCLRSAERDESPTRAGYPCCRPRGSSDRLVDVRESRLMTSIPAPSEPPRSRRGRPTELTPDVQATVVALVRAGLHARSCSERSRRPSSRAVCRGKLFERILVDPHTGKTPNHRRHPPRSGPHGHQRARPPAPLSPATATGNSRAVESENPFYEPEGPSPLPRC